MDYDIVIAGGGFAGAYCARALGRRIRGTQLRAALVAEMNVLVFQPMLAEVAGGALGPLDVVNPLRMFCRGVDVLQGSVERIDWSGRRLVLDGGRFTRNHEIGFKQLVLALGAVTNLAEMPGMADYGRPVKDIADAVRLRATIVNRLEEANLAEEPEARARLLTFVVVGGGYTGVEVAGQLLDFVTEAKRYYVHLREHPLRVILVHSHGQLLPEIGGSLGAYAQSVLEERGVELRLNTRVASLSAGRVTFADGSTIDSHTVVTTIGSGPNPVVTDLCRQIGVEAPKGRIAVEPTMRVPGQEGLWAAGDCASVPWSDRGTPKVSPPTAQFAVRQGRQLADNLLRAARGEAPRPFRFRYLGQLATVGKRHAVAEILGMHFRGFFAWWLWRTIYLAKLPGIQRRLRVMIDWTFDLVVPHEISVLIPVARTKTQKEEPTPPR